MDRIRELYMIHRAQILCIEHLKERRQTVAGCAECKKKHRRVIDDEIKIIGEDIHYIAEEIKKEKNNENK